MTTELQGLLDRVVRLLDAAGVPFMIAGSFASAAHGLPRATQDLDLVVDPTRPTPNATHRPLSYPQRMQAVALDPPPLVCDEIGEIRVGRTRVTLASLVFAFDAGATPEEIVQKYPTLDLASVYAVCAHVLAHRPEVDAYLRAQASESEQVRDEMQRHFPPRGFRERLQARRVAT